MYVISENIPIHIAISRLNLYDEYNRHAAVTIKSIILNCNPNRKIIFHILYDAYSSNIVASSLDPKSMYYELIGTRNVEIIFHPIEPSEKFYLAYATKIFTVATLLRLYIPDLLSEIHKVIYIDCDTVVTLDISELYDLDMGDCSISAVIDGNYDVMWRSFYKKIKILPELYFNAGLMVLNLDKIRITGVDLVKLAEDFLQEHPSTPYLDQDILNKYYQHDCMSLPKKYNFYPKSQADDELLNNCIIHYYAAIHKPWTSYSGLVDDYYWKYLIETPFAKDKLKLIEYARAAPSRGDFISTISQWLYRCSISNQLYILYLLSIHLWCKQIRIYINEIKRRVHINW